MNLPSTCLPLPEIYYDANTKEYWRQNDRGTWHRINDSTFEDELLSLGYNGARPDDGIGLSEVRRAKLDIQKSQDVNYAGPLAGYHAGFHRVQNRDILVTTSPVIIEPRAGAWPILNQLLEGMLVDGELDQRPYLYGWLKRGYESLKSSCFTHGQAFCVAGPSDAGKSLLQTVVISAILGGRIGKPYQHMVGGTSFNSDFIGCEHLMIEDDSASTDIRSRRNLGAALKTLTVNTTQRCHQKNREALMLEPFWRVTLSTNDENENLLILPPLDDSMKEKSILLKVRNMPMPMPGDTVEEKRVLRETLLSEIPAFLQFLTNYEIPAELKSDRFGIRSYQHPALLEALTAAQPEVRLLEVVDANFQRLLRNAGLKEGPWEGSATELEHELTSEFSLLKREANKLLSWTNACGTYLGRLMKMNPDRITERKVNGKTIWTIQAPARL